MSQPDFLWVEMGWVEKISIFLKSMLNISDSFNPPVNEFEPD